MAHAAVVGAGGRIREGDSLAQVSGTGSPKSLLPIAGRPMVQWVLDAIAAAQEIEEVFLVGLEPGSDLSCSGKPLHYLPPQPNAVDSLLAGGAAVKRSRPGHPLALWVAADAPLVRAEMLDWFIVTARRTDHDFYFPVISPSLMRGRFPAVQRTQFKFRDRSVLVGDVAAGDTRIADRPQDPLFYQLAGVNRSAWRMARVLGPLTLLRFLTGRLTTRACLKLVRDRFGVNARIVDCPWAEMGMDVDNIAQYQLVCRELGSN